MIKKTTSLTLAFSGVAMLVSSIVLYLGPAGHVSHFCPWSFMGLYRQHWMLLHLNSGLLFCLTMVVHTYLNWRLLWAYVRKSKPLIKGGPLSVSLVLTLYVCVGGHYRLPPMDQVLDIARASRKASVMEYGTPPYGASAGSPVVKIARYMGWDPQKVLTRLHQVQIRLSSPNQSLADLARINHTTIGRLLDIMSTEPEEYENEER